MTCSDGAAVARSCFSAIAAVAILAACGAVDEQGNVASADAPAAAPAEAAPEAPPPKPAPTDAVAATDVLPSRFHGTYDESEQACGGPSEYRLTVSARELRFHESVGTVREVARDGPDAVGVTADYQGEGESWRSVRRLRLGDGGSRLTVSGDGTSMTRVRCPA